MSASPQREFVLTEAEKDLLKRKRQVAAKGLAASQYLEDEVEEAEDPENNPTPDMQAADALTDLQKCDVHGYGPCDCFYDQREEDGEEPWHHPHEWQEQEAAAPPPAQQYMDEPEILGGEPDLHHYFDGFPHIPDEKVILICRAYASYLASLRKKTVAVGRPRAPAAKRSKKYAHLHPN